MPANSPSGRVVKRLLEIEQLAEQARRDAAQRMTDITLSLQRDSDMQLVAALLTGGPVSACPNLSLEGERMAGLLVGEGACPTLYFEEYDPLVRQRFSIAHEIGHFYLHPRYGADAYARCTPDRVDSGDTLNEEGLDQEGEADAFAGAFLIPAQELRADRARFGRSVPFLAERYIVSPPAMRRRLKTSELLDREDRPSL